MTEQQQPPQRPTTVDPIEQRLWFIRTRNSGISDRRLDEQTEDLRAATIKYAETVAEIVRRGEHVVGRLIHVLDKLPSVENTATQAMSLPLYPPEQK